jgi:F-type H+-transporting ATPase subunit delta
MDEEIGRVRATVRTAVPIPDDLKDKVAGALAKATGKEVILVTEEDPDIIGGVVAHVGDIVWDGSIKSQLAGLKESIGRGEQG